MCLKVMHQKPSASSVVISSQPEPQTEKKKHTTKCGLTELLRDFTQISPSLNKHKGVLGTQLHFASSEDKPKHMAEHQRQQFFLFKKKKKKILLPLFFKDTA